MPGPAHALQPDGILSGAAEVIREYWLRSHRVTKLPDADSNSLSFCPANVSILLLTVVLPGKGSNVLDETSLKLVMSDT